MYHTVIHLFVVPGNKIKFILPCSLFLWTSLLCGYLLAGNTCMYEEWTECIIYFYYKCFGNNTNQSFDIHAFQMTFPNESVPPRLSSWHEDTLHSFSAIHCGYKNSVPVSCQLQKWKYVTHECLYVVTPMYSSYSIASF